MFTFRDSNNPFETCSIEITGLAGVILPGFFEIDAETLKTWVLLNCISKEQADKLYSFLWESGLHTLKITTNQGNWLTCFQTEIVSPMDEITINKADGTIMKKPYPIVPNGLLMMQSQNWIEDALIEDLSEEVFRHAIFSFSYLPYWFNKTLSTEVSKTVQVKDGLSLTFFLEKHNTIRRFSLQETKQHLSHVIIETDKEISVLDYYNLHRDLLLLFRFCTGLNLPKADIRFEAIVEGGIRKQYKFHYIFPLKGLTKEPNPNCYVKQIILLDELIRNPRIIARWIDCVRTYQHAMELLGEVFYSTDVIESDRVLKQIQVFDRLNKAFIYSNKSNCICLFSRLKLFIDNNGLSFGRITNLDNEQICKSLKDYRNSESHGDWKDKSLSFHQMEEIMHILLTTLIVNELFRE